MNKLTKVNSHFYRTALSLLFCCFSLIAFSQKTDTSKIDDDNEVDQKIENIAEGTDAELDYSDLLDQLKLYQAHPMNLNTATAEDLKQLVFLNSIQITNLLEHISKNGKLITLYELQTIDGFSLDIIYKILPYVYVSGDVQQRQFVLKEVFHYGNSQVMFRYQRVLEEQAGFAPATDSALAASPNSHYLGSPEKLYLKYRFNYYNNISWGITGEKDSGEEFFKGSQKNGFDFYSAHFFIRNLKFVKALAIGDYNIQFGQGLTLWSGLGFGKSSDAIGIKKNAQGILPFTSVEENNFMRGVATTVGTKHFDLSLFFSSHKIDANVSAYDSLNNEATLISSLQESGLHSTPSEIADKHSIGETVIGGHLAYRNDHLIIGATAYKATFGSTLQRDLQLYNQFQFTGKENSNVGIDYSYSIQNFNFFGEVSRSENGAIAYLNGVLMSLDPKFSLSLLQRNYPKDYQNLLCSSFSENSTLGNERAIYVSIVAKPHRFWTLTAYADNFSFPWMKYRTDAPSNGGDYLVQLNYKPTKKFEMYFRYRETDKQLNNSGTNIINYLDPTQKNNFRLNIVYPGTKTISLKNRIEYTNYVVGNAVPQHGFLLYQDVSFKKLKSPFSFSLRYAVFDCDTYDTRIYSFENDVLYAYSIPAFYNKGSRYYIVGHYRVNRHIDVWLRYAQTFYSNVNVISSSLTQINGNKRSEVKAQIRIKF